MKKILLSLIIVCFAVLGAYAQDENTTKISAGFDVGIPIGPASTIYGATGGVSVKLEVPVVTPLSFTVSAGYLGYVTKGGFSTGYDTYNGSYSYGSVASFVPVEVGAKVYLTPMVYVEGNVGGSFRISGDNLDYESKSMALIYAPAAGVYIPIRSVGVDVSLRYESRLGSGIYGNFNQVAVRAAFSFGPTK